MRGFRDWMVRRVVWVTLVIAGLGSAIVILACPMGLPVISNGFSSEPAAVWTTFMWFGVFFAQLVSLGAWAALRDAPWLARISIPAALLILLIVASAVGHRINSTPTDGSSAVASIAAVGTAFFLFLLLRKGGWRIGPRREGSSVFSLKQLFLAVTFLAVAAAVWTWSATNSQGHMIFGPNAAAVLIGFSFAFASCLLAIPAIAIVMNGRKRYAIWLLLALLLSWVGLAAGQPFGPTSVPVILPIVFVLMTMWFFNAYRMCGYHFTGRQPSEQRRSRWFIGGACLAVVGVTYSPFALRGLRVESAQNQPWKDVGVFPLHVEGTQLTAVTFFRSQVGVTRAGIDALKRQPSLREINVECAASPKQIGWLVELRGVDAITLSGKNKGDPHLKSLYQATHLERIELYDTSATVAEVKKLQRVLVNCQVRMTDVAGTVVVGIPANTRTNQIDVSR